jgi:hypothetical protein
MGVFHETPLSDDRSIGKPPLNAEKKAVPCKSK